MNIRVATVSLSLSVQSHRGVIADHRFLLRCRLTTCPSPRPSLLGPPSSLTFARTASCLICRLGMQNANIINLPENYTFKYCASPLLSASSSTELTPLPFIRPSCCLQTSTTP